MLKVPKKDNVGTEEYFYVGNTVINPLFNVLLSNNAQIKTAKRKCKVCHLCGQWQKAA